MNALRLLGELVALRKLLEVAHPAQCCDQLAVVERGLREAVFSLGPDEPLDGLDRFAWLMPDVWVSTEARLLVEMLHTSPTGRAFLRAFQAAFPHRRAWFQEGVTRLRFRLDNPAAPVVELGRELAPECVSWHPVPGLLGPVGPDVCGASLARCAVR